MVFTKDEARTFIETVIDEKMKQRPTGSNTTSTTTTIFGGFSNVDLQTAEEWISNNLKEMQIVKPLEMYYKGDAFTRQLFAEFTDADTIDTISRRMTTDKPQVAGHSIWCKPDRPIEIRTPISFLLGLRWHLVQWGFNKKEVKVKDSEMMMTVGKVPVLQVSVTGTSLTLNWLDQTWQQWEDLQKSEEFSKLITNANERLAKSMASNTKGKGKGPGRSG